LAEEKNIETEHIETEHIETEEEPGKRKRAGKRKKRYLSFSPPVAQTQSAYLGCKGEAWRLIDITRRLKIA